MTLYLPNSRGSMNPGHKIFAQVTVIQQNYAWVKKSTRIGTISLLETVSVKPKNHVEQNVRNNIMEVYNSSGKRNKTY